MSASLSASSALAKRYAKALFDLALEANLVEKVEKDLLQLRAELAASEALRKVLQSPLIDRTEKSAVLQELIEKSSQGLTQKFIALLGRNNRFSALAAIIDAFVTLFSEHRGEVLAEVTSSVALSEQQLSLLRSSLKKVLGREVKIKTSVDNAILGGLKVRIGSKLFDASLLSKLERLRLASQHAASSLAA